MSVEKRDWQELCRAGSKEHNLTIWSRWFPS
jgi:hypothetical protein